MRVVGGAMSVGTGKGDGYREAEAVMRQKGIAEIRKVEEETKRQMMKKKEELRQLVGNRYRDLIDSADSILAMKSSCLAISSNISSIRSSILASLSTDNGVSTYTPDSKSTSTTRHSLYAVACRVKYLVDTPENIWACLDEFMFLEAASRYIRATHVHHCLRVFPDHRVLSRFPLLQHQWLIVDAFKFQISQRSRDRLLDRDLSISSYADALAAVSVVDKLPPVQVLSLFLESRMSWILHLRSSIPATSDAVVSFFCQVLNIILVTIGQVGELFLRVLNDMPLFYKVVLSSPPASQLFGGIPGPEDEVRLWKLFREDLDSSMTFLENNDVSRLCVDWLKSSTTEINPCPLVDCIRSGQDLASAEKLIRETIDNKQVLKASLDWLRNVFGSEIELPWCRIRELVLQYDYDLWDGIFEEAFVQRMKAIIASGFDYLSASINVGDSVLAIGDLAGEPAAFPVSRPFTGAGIWFVDANAKKSTSLSLLKAFPKESDFETCLSVYLGSEISRIKDLIETHCQCVLNDTLLFLESPKAGLRAEVLSDFLQEKCYHSISMILEQIKKELKNLSDDMEKLESMGQPVPAVIIVERSLFLGRLLYAFKNHFKYISLILNSPRFWIKDDSAQGIGKSPLMWKQLNISTDSFASISPGRHSLTGSRKQSSFANAALFSTRDGQSSHLEEVNKISRELCVAAYGLWISWLSSELSRTLKRDLEMDDALSSSTALRGWEETVVKQQEADDGKTEMKIFLPCMPSPYIISFMFRACEEIHRIGGHVIDKIILHKLAIKVLETVVGTYEEFVSNQDVRISEKGVLQILLDLKFSADTLSGGCSITDEELSQGTKANSLFRRKQQSMRMDQISGDKIKNLITCLSQKLDPIDWQTYEPYLWENEKQSYLRHAVLFGFFVQLNRKYTDTVQNLPTNPESNIMRCTVLPRFKYLPISAPALSSNRMTKRSLPASNDLSLRTAWKGYSNSEVFRKNDVDDSPGFGVAAPILKSFMQVGSRFGESTLKLGSMLTDGQVGIFKDRSGAAMSTFGDILPAQAAGLLSSFSVNKSDH